jgi:hypothetical protein
MRRTPATEFFAILILFTACTSVVPGRAAPPPVEDEVCYAPWEHETYASGRAIPAPGPDATVPLCGL